MLILTTTFSNCTRWKIEKDTPKCVKKEIVKFKRNQLCNDISVDEYIFQGITVYVFNIGNTCGADMSSKVIDSSCNELGAFGGFAGVTEINGEEFSSAVFVKTVWKK